MASSAPIPFQQWLQRQRRRTWIAGSMGALFVLSVGIWRGRDALALERWAQTPHSLQGIEPDGALRLNHGGEQTTVVLLGIASMGPEARVWLASEGIGKSVRVGFDPRQPTDPSGRRAVYLYRENGRMINERLISRGLAEPDEQRHRLRRWFHRLASRSAQ
jgi:hypothetical protein